MADIDSHPLLITDTVAVWDVVCTGACRHKSEEECNTETRVVFPYRGVYVRHVGRTETVAEANQVVFFNVDEPYRVSHPVAGGDKCTVVSIHPSLLADVVSQYDPGANGYSGAIPIIDSTAVRNKSSNMTWRPKFSNRNCPPPASSSSLGSTPCRNPPAALRPVPQ